MAQLELLPEDLTNDFMNPDKERLQREKSRVKFAICKISNQLKIEKKSIFAILAVFFEKRRKNIFLH